jgi:chloramphenicol O-acetyltransferase type A
MTFDIIDVDKWNRKEYYNHYFSKVPCTYSITAKIDITKIKEKKQKLYPAMLYYIATIVNRHSEFRTAINEKGKLGVYSEMIPCYTVFHKDTETFSNIWTEYIPNYDDFSAAYELDLLKYGKNKKMIGKGNVPANSFPVSMIPWLTFEGFNLNLQKGYDYLIPIFTMGKYYQEDCRTILPLTIQVHHAVCDGFHVCRFVNELQELINM